MKDIILGQYSYLFEDELKKENEAHKIEETEKKGYFMSSVRKGLLANLKQPLKRIGYDLADEVYSLSLGTMTLFLEHENPTKDLEVTLTINTVGNEEDKVKIAISQDAKRVIKTEEYITGNISRDITMITDTVVETIRKKVR